MNIQDYYRRLSDSCQNIFEATISDSESFGNVHHLATCLFEFSALISDEKEKELLKVVSSQIEISALNLSFGLYRQAFSAMRLSLEMGLGVIYFSAFKLEHHEWLNGNADIKWSKLIDKDNGVLSRRFSDAFFLDLSPFIGEYHSKAIYVYRQLSQFVHGNFETWESNNLMLLRNEDLITKYFDYLTSVKEILLFCLCCRFLKSFSRNQIESMSFLGDELGHYESIRLLIGIPKENLR